MDYEKAYKAVLKTATQWIKDGCSDKEKICLECVFPELRESEDERIRKKCIELIKRVIPSGDNQSQESKEILDCIAYLEKQKEPTTEELYAEAGTTEKEYIANTMKMVRAMREKKQEQKPAEIDFEDWDTLGYIRDIVRKHVRRDEEFSVLDKWLTEHYVNQKSAEWSEDDEQFLLICKNALYKYQRTDQWDANIISKWLDEKLKSIHPVKQEWTEEDKENIESIKIILYKALPKGISCKEEVLDLTDWLNNLRPSWKHSEEQMNSVDMYKND